MKIIVTVPIVVNDDFAKDEMLKNDETPVEFALRYLRSLFTDLNAAHDIYNIFLNSVSRKNIIIKE